ncbi:hypothetical protein [Bergeyella zoohelcum]|uniref:Outer membrane protein beta-barrel domain-containing protein n=1 Tax=Bergeyella zoohelcum TaxID=1015 RepID=A0A376BYE3_9FLAO|nr:hypothetical protein [Bergeyella zoohelcum]EKB61414.1 hypothetical protein HMPREF9700_00909 [Bergeyella zoohelcum CCUG 30536]SSZ46494.1 Uncharacterised protein [Bergeyella zoohelcum]
MRKALFLTIFLGSKFAFGQESNINMSVGAGYAQEGGINAGVTMKDQKRGYGMYFHCRGITGIGDYSSGIDFSDISNTSTNITQGDTGYLGIVFGGLYLVKNTGLSLGGGVGYGAKVTEYHYVKTHHFQYIGNKYSFSTIVDRTEKMTFEGMIDYKINHKSKSSIGLQLGYSSFHKAFGLLYYEF